MSTLSEFVIFDNFAVLLALGSIIGTIMNLLRQTAPALLTIGLTTHAVTWSQTMLDAGSLRQQIEQQRNIPTLPSTPNRTPRPQQASQSTIGLSIQVSAFEIKGNHILSSQELQALLGSYLNRTLYYDDLQRAADTIVVAYRNAGWLARVYLPEQDITGGTVTLQVIEAHFAGLRHEGEASKSVMRSEIEAYFDHQQKMQHPFNATAVDRALLLVDDLPGLSAAGTLAPGKQDGETAVVLQTTDEPFIYGDVGVDNTGARSTGSNRLSSNINISSPGGRGELISMSLLHTEGSDYSRISLTVPDGHNGLRLGVNGSNMTYRVINGPGSGSSAQIRGHSGSMGIDWSFPWWRSRSQNLYLTGALENKNFYTQDTQVRSAYEANSLRIGLSGNHFDDLGGGGANSASMQFTKGQLTNMQAHTQLDNIERQYWKLNYSLSRQQLIAADQSVFVSLTAQHAAQALDSSEKLYIGGPQTVRAYPVSELGGERGQVLTGEWRWRLDSAWVASAFADLGRVVSLPIATGEFPATLRLRGQGLNLSWQSATGMNARLTWSQRSGHNPKPTSTGTDGDGTLKLNRLWLSSNLPF